jgi:hypothetical protein
MSRTRLLDFSSERAFRGTIAVRPDAVVVLAKGLSKLTVTLNLNPSLIVVSFQGSQRLGRTSRQGSYMHGCAIVEEARGRALHNVVPMPAPIVGSGAVGAVHK